MNKVEGLSIWMPIGLFVLYIVSYYLILKRKKVLEATTISDETEYKFIKFFSKWYSAVYLIFVIITLYSVR